MKNKEKRIIKYRIHVLASPVNASAKFNQKKRKSSHMLSSQRPYRVIRYFQTIFSSKAQQVCREILLQNSLNYYFYFDDFI